MWCLLVILLLFQYIISVSCECKYIRKDGKGYELDTCSFSSTFDSISWGFYCKKMNATNSYVAVYKQWDTINCPDTITPTNILFQIDCNGIDDGDDDCDCIGGTEEDKCSIATLRIEDCSNSDEMYQETKYTTNICESTGEQTSKQIICDNGNNLITMSYEDNECGGYGFKINHGEGYNLNINNDEICTQIMCQSAVSQYSFIYGFGAIYAIIMAIKLI